jgi:hypothetical protein
MNEIYAGIWQSIFERINVHLQRYLHEAFNGKKSDFSAVEFRL